MTEASSPDSGTWQTNGVVWAQAYFGDDLIIGGNFTTIRPPGAAPGTQELAAPHLAALNISTGAPDPNFDPSHLGTNGVVYALTPSPDGRQLYVGGSFTRLLNAGHRGNIAVLNANLRVKWSFKVQAGSKTSDVHAIVTSPDGSTVYLGGTFGTLDGKRRRFLGAVTPSGSVLPWAAGNTMDGSVRTLLYAKSSSGDRVIAGGYWTKVQGVADRWAVGLDTTAGKVIPGWQQLPHDFYDCAKGSYVADMVTDGTRVIMGIGGYRTILDNTTKHCDEGLMAVDPADGSLDYFLPTDGDVQALSIIGNQVYASGHFKHAIDRTGACGARNKAVWRGHLLSATSSGVLDCTWKPQMNGAKGGWSSATDGKHLSFGGDFNRVQYAANQTLHQGVVQFSLGS